MVKNLPADAGDARDAGSMPGSGRSSGVGHGIPLQYSCLENPMDRRTWWPEVPRVTSVEYDLVAKPPPHYEMIVIII